MSKDASQANWTTISNELDKIGINIDEDKLAEMIEGQLPPIEKIFSRIERYMKIIAGADFLKFDNLVEEDFKEAELEE